MRVGFVGLGNMGKGMAGNLVRAGLELTVRDVRRDVVDELVAAGASSAATNREVGERSAAVFVAVFDDVQVREVCLGDEAGDAGVLAGLPEGGTLVIHSTIAAKTVQDIADVASSRGVAVIDAAMTAGGDVAAREGALTFFVGGDAAAVESVRPTLGAMAKNVFHMGPLGSGVVTKILNNFLAVSNLTLVREAIRLTKAAGVDEDRLLSMIGAGGVGSSWVSNNWQRLRIQEANYTTGQAGFVSMARKDLELAREVAADSGVSMPILGFIVDSVVPELDATGLTG